MKKEVSSDEEGEQDDNSDQKEEDGEEGEETITQHNILDLYANRHTLNFKK